MQVKTYKIILPFGVTRINIKMLIHVTLFREKTERHKRDE